MELPLVRIRTRRIPFWMPLLLVFSFILVAAVPIAAGGGERPMDASMYVSRTQASPGDEVIFWIWIDPLKEKARNLVVMESDLEGFTVVSSVAPDTCLETQLTWVCIQDDLRPFAIEVRAVVESGMTGRDLINQAQVEVWEKNGHHGEDDHKEGNAISVSAEVHVVPAAEVEEPENEVRLTSTQVEIVPDSPFTYRVEVTNRGKSPANNVSVVVSVPDSMVMESATRWPTILDGQLIWILDSVPVGSMELLFNATVPASNHADQVEMAVAVTYEDGNGGAVRVETKPSSISVLPVPAAPPVWPLQLGVILAVLAFVGRSLFLPPGPIGSALTKARARTRSSCSTGAGSS